MDFISQKTVLSLPINFVLDIYFATIIRGYSNFNIPYKVCMENLEHLVTCDFILPVSSCGSLVSGTIEKSSIVSFLRELTKRFANQNQGQK